MRTVQVKVFQYLILKDELCLTKKVVKLLKQNKDILDNPIYSIDISSPPSEVDISPSRLGHLISRHISTERPVPRVITAGWWAVLSHGRGSLIVLTARRVGAL